MSLQKVFFFDVDGTLLPHGNEKGVDVKTIYALNQLIENGHDVVLATGKSEQMIEAQIAQTKVKSHITMNGACIVVDGCEQHMETVSQAAIDEFIKIAKQNGLMLGCQKRHEYFMHETNFDHSLASQILNKVSLDVPNVRPEIDSAQKIGQLWFLGDHSMLDFTKDIVDGHRLLKWHEMGCDIVMNHVDKANAIKKYLQIVYPTTEVQTYAFGDGNNDIEMLKSVDFGIAMGNGVKNLKKIATEITENCEQLGVYNYLVRQDLIKEM